MVIVAWFDCFRSRLHTATGHVSARPASLALELMFAMPNDAIEEVEVIQVYEREYRSAVVRAKGRKACAKPVDWQGRAID